MDDVGAQDAIAEGGAPSPHAEAPAQSAPPQDAAPAEDAGPRLTLEDAVRIALRANRMLEASRLEVAKAADRTDATRSHYYPSINLAATEGYLLAPVEFDVKRGDLGTVPGLGPLPAQNETLRTSEQWVTLLGATASQPLSQLWRISLSVDQRKLQEEIARQDDRLERQRTVAEVKRTYYLILQLQGALSAAEEAMELYRELGRVIAQDVKVEVVHHAEALEVKAQLAQAEYRIRSIQNGIRTSQERLNALLGRRLDTPMELEPIGDPLARAWEAETALELALERRPEILQAELKTQLARQEVKVKQAAYIPDVSLSVAYLRQLNLEFVPDEFALAGVTLTWNLFDGGRKGRELAEARKSLLQAATGQEETRERIAVEVSSLRRKLEESQLQVTAARLQMEAAAEKLRIARDLQAQQSALLKDVLEAQAAHAGKVHEYHQAMLDYWTSEADLERALGQDIDLP